MAAARRDRVTPEKSTIVRIISAILRGTAPAAPELAAATLEAFFRHSRRFAVPERELRWLAVAERGELVVAGRRLPTWSWGHGPAILLVHGWQGRGAQLGAFAMPLADAGYRVVTWDAPGHGANPGRLSSLPEMIDAVVAAVRAAGPVAGVVAHSVGAAAVTGALARGSVVERAVFLAPPAEPGAYLAHAGAWLGLPPAIAERTRRRIERRFSVRMDDLAPLAQAPRMTTPLVVVHDHEDHEVPWRDGHRLAAAWPGARLISTRGLGHRRPLRDPTVIGTAVEFLSPAP
ncbi:MAG TPA: alpha/beta hydrolase, partial [Thermoanaerobaculia bacterium]|nr:alpha/beta hydrolase [Thermoanaerobaculia bacterium]